MNNGELHLRPLRTAITINLSHDSQHSDLTGAVAGLTVNVPNNFNFNYDAARRTLQATLHRPLLPHRLGAVHAGAAAADPAKPAEPRRRLG